MHYLKHKDGKPPKKQQSKKLPAAQPSPPNVTVDVDMSGLEAEMANLAHSIKSYVVNAYDAENKLTIFTGPSGSGYHPVLIALEPSDTVDHIIEVSERIATAFERIADALSQRSA
jgi:hypothetical protein